MKDKLSKEEFWDQMDPDKLNLLKKDLLKFCDDCISEWNKNKIGNIHYISAMTIMKTQVRLTPEPVLKAFWKKIMFWMYDLTFKNALANTKDTMLKELSKIGKTKSD